MEADLAECTSLSHVVSSLSLMPPEVGAGYADPAAALVGAPVLLIGRQTLPGVNGDAGMRKDRSDTEISLSPHPPKLRPSATSGWGRSHLPRVLDLNVDSATQTDLTDVLQDDCCRTSCECSGF